MSIFTDGLKEIEKHKRLTAKKKCINCKKKLTVANTANLISVKDGLIGMSCIKCQVIARKEGKVVFGRLS